MHVSLLVNVAFHLSAMPPTSLHNEVSDGRTINSSAFYFVHVCIEVSCTFNGDWRWWHNIAAGGAANPQHPKWVVLYFALLSLW